MPKKWEIVALDKSNIKTDGTFSMWDIVEIVIYDCETEADALVRATKMVNRPTYYLKKVSEYPEQQETEAQKNYNNLLNKMAKYFK